MPAQDIDQLLERLLAEGCEKDWIEFKQNNADPRQVAEYISALSNSAVLGERDKAFLVYGIHDRSLEIVGTHVRFANLRNGGEHFENWINRVLSPSVNLAFHEHEYQGKHIEVIEIEACFERPLTVSGEAFIRVGSHKKKLSDFPERERALWIATGRRRFEHATALGNASREQVFELLDVDSLFSLRGVPKPESSEEQTTQLINHGCVVDNLDGSFDVTNLGAIALALTLEAFPSTQSKRCRIIKYRGKDKRESIGPEEVIDAGYASGFERLVELTMSKVEVRETYIGGVRRYEPVIPEVAIREVLSNALVHQDFTKTGSSPMIEVYSDRMEVTNPGNSLVHSERLIIDRQSRNESLASTLKDLGICEERGGGIDKAVIAIEAQNLPAPLFISSTDTMRVVLFGERDFSTLSKQDKLRACSFHCQLRWLGHDYMSNSSLRERFGLDDKDYQAVSGVISEAIKEGLIVPADPKQGKRNARYVPAFVRMQD